MNFDPERFEPRLGPAPAGLDVTTGDPDIDALALHRLIFKAMDRTSGYGWDRETAEEIAGMYRAFLFLCKRYPDEVIVPPREVDEFWHLHILDTRHYHADCHTIFGHYLHHFPYAGLEGTELPAGQDERYVERTTALIAAHFPQLLEPDDEGPDHVAQ